MPNWIVRAGIIMLFVACFVRRMHFPAVADEIDFVLPIEKWVAEGPQQFGLWHSPIYPWLEMIVGKLVGFSTAASRTIGFVTQALTAYLMYRAALYIRPDLNETAKTLILVIGLLSPVALGSSLLLDYDTTVLVLATAFYFYLLARLSSTKKWSLSKGTLVFGCALALCLLAKETTPLIYPIGFLVAYRKRFGAKKALLGSAGSWILGVVLFFIVTWLWCAIYKLPIKAVFQMDLLGLHNHGRTSSPGLTSDLGARIWTKIFPAFWVGVPLVALFFARLRKIFKTDEAISGICAIVLAVAFAYTLGLRQVTYHFPKYMAPVLLWVPWLLIVSENLQKKSIAPWALGIAAWFAINSDPLWPLYARNAQSLLIWSVVFGVPFGVWAAVYFAKPKQRKSLPAFANLALLVSIAMAASYCRAALFSDYSIHYWYGDRAFVEAKPIVEHWRKSNPNGTLFIPAKDLAYAFRYLGARYTQKDELEDRASRICAMKTPVMLFTRVREDSSLLFSPALRVYRGCLQEIAQGVDIVYGSSYSQAEE